MTSNFVEIVPLFHHQGNYIPFATIRWHDFRACFTPLCRVRPLPSGSQRQKPDHVGDQEAPLDQLEPGGGGKRNAKAKMPNHRLITGTVWRGAINKEKAPRGAGLRGGSFGVTLRSLTSFAGLRCANIAIQARGFCMPRPRLATRPRPPPTGDRRAGAKTTFAKP